MRLILILLLTFLSLGLCAQEAPLQAGVEKIAEDSKDTRYRRSLNQYYALGNFAPFDLLIPSKYGVTLGVISDPGKTWEFEYLRGSISIPYLVEDLGKMTDERYSLIARSYGDGNSFNFSYGITYFDFSMHLGDQLLNKVSGGNYPALDLVQLQALGFNVGIGNRWSFDRNITFGIDWISWSQPVFITKKQSAFLDHASDPGDRDDVDKAMKLISYFPRFSFLKLQLGILF